MNLLFANKLCLEVIIFNINCRSLNIYFFPIQYMKLKIYSLVNHLMNPTGQQDCVHNIDVGRVIYFIHLITCNISNSS